METVTRTLESLSQAPPTTFLNLTVFPLLGKCDYVRNYIPLRDAIRAGSASVREVSLGGSVPELIVKNRGKQAILILEGEELVGAKQNRTANVTILVAARTSLRIPVTCVESGRWGYTSKEFEPSEQIHFVGGRRNKMASVSESIRRHGSRRADQGAVWDDIAAKSSRMRVSSANTPRKISPTMRRMTPRWIMKMPDFFQLILKRLTWAAIRLTNRTPPSR